MDTPDPRCSLQLVPSNRSRDSSPLPWPGLVAPRPAPSRWPRRRPGPARRARRCGTPSAMESTARSRSSGRIIVDLLHSFPCSSGRPRGDGPQPWPRPLVLPPSRPATWLHPAARLPPTCLRSTGPAISPHTGAASRCLPTRRSDRQPHCRARERVLAAPTTSCGGGLIQSASVSRCTSERRGKAARDGPGLPLQPSSISRCTARHNLEIPRSSAVPADIPCV